MAALGDWERLGRVVLRARMVGGYSDTKAWARAVERSTRVVLGLERGEPVGPRTLTNIELALGWPAGYSWRVLAGEVSTDEESSPPVPVAKDVPTAILSDPDLLPEARAHLLSQYELLLRLTAPLPGPVVEEQERRRQSAKQTAATVTRLRGVKEQAIPPAKPPRKG